MKVYKLETQLLAAHLESLGPRALLFIKLGPCCYLGSLLPLAQAQETLAWPLPYAAHQVGQPSSSQHD